MAKGPKPGFKQSPEHIAKRVASWHASTAHQTNAARFRQLNESRRGIPLPEEHREKIAVANKDKQNALGFKRSEEFRRKLADYYAANPEKHNFYVDGKAEERLGARHAEMARIEYRLWREAVFARDNWTCQLCGERGGKLNADHIKEWAKHPELRLAIDNGRTLCRRCHYERHSGPRGLA